MALSAVLLGGCAATPSARHTDTPVTGDPTDTAAVVVDVESEFRSALQLMKASEWERATAKLAAITASAPGLPGAWLNLGIARVKTGDSTAAEQAFRKTLELDRSQVAAYNELGILLRRSGRLEEAAATYAAGLQVNPNAEDIHWNLGILYDRYLPNPAQALYHYERYRELTQSDDRQLQSWIDALREQTGELNVARGAVQ
jgi:Flp pilus assembly protein TadD